MNINKDGKTLYFSDEELENETNGEKRVFVTKRINGKENHTNVAKHKTNKKNKPKNESTAQNIGTFSFDNEIVIGVTKKEDDNAKGKKKNNKKKKTNKKKKVNQNKDINQNDEYQKEQNQNPKNKGRNKKKKTNKYIVKILGILLLLVAIVIFALTAPIFSITDIKVEGNTGVSTENIISMSGLKKGENIFKFNNQVINSIKENMYIDNVQVKRKLPGTVVIKVEEREIKYQINLINSYAYIDKNGYILENSTIKKEVPILVGLKITENELINKTRLEAADLGKLIKIAKIMDSAKSIEIEKLITEINTENENDYVLYLESKQKRIHIGDTTNLTNKMLYVQKILENEEGKSGIAFVNGDIGAGFKPYFREE